MSRNLACRTLVCAALLASAAAAMAQDTGTIHGTVVDSVTGQPIARVLVESPTNGLGLLTDSAGHFAFSDVAVGTANLRYRRPGYFDPANQQTSAYRAVTVATGLNDVTLELEPAAALHGTVQTADNDSPAGVVVELYAARIVDGRRTWQLQVQDTERLSSDGSFDFEELPAGNYLVHTQGSLDPTPPGVQERVRSGYAPVFAPDTSDIHTASVYTLGAGQLAEARIRISRLPFYPVSIRVAGAQGGRQFQVTGSGFTGWPVRFHAEEADGEALQTELPNGSYTLRSMGGGRQGASGVLTFQVAGAPVSGPIVTVAESGGIPVESEAIAPEAGAGSDTGSTPPRIGTVTLVSATDPEMPSLVEGVDYDENGAGILRRTVPPGLYWVSALVSGTGYLAGLSSGGTDLLRNPLTVVAGTAPAIHATLREDGGTLAVTRTGDAQQEPCVVELIPLSEGGVDQTTFAETTGSTAGVINFSNLAPGDYLVLATHSRMGIAFREPGVLQRLGGTRVSVAAGGSAQASVSTFSTPPAGVLGMR